MHKDYREILERGAKKKKEFKAFLGVLAKSNSPSPRQILEVHAEVEKEINCLECANCCKTTPALVENEEFDRLAKAIGVTRSKFVQGFLELDEDGDFVFNQSPCRFLGPDNKCCIYEDRPNACREYPHTDDSNFRKYQEMNLENTKICPIVVRVLEKLMKLG
ncbi:YkgJ family cysteine cluster protein [Luteibaculum oceani]|uniref:YkgJ family cysteine cluster protein n=1 Tax=Luteibaculum oceani TaxID=1294296 RepID=A0A5C6VEF4_9FLAO|nr:YkgJ family cysteine cluster protein [Luteibaculum oceani]TXC81498.1 YkgJ family cysteine cluster protein [Luteibaculum oceani]